eukprot:Protomagalhaensia_sp_Gyna_25__3699@NODE_331_length_3848_cov_15_007614_g258_i0_p4_GENE_NODE_331_length_3848_cov_15_007614_g258_i0NODE_331_length_3848_cov_15_007614_g258_i0_p4_ORF_typecomplete_len121_score2_26FoP_duplication/PF13865_6/4_9e03FoP_duplication/PF13865_6/0_76_NODE_331_length_3848_cov_15_007614_g258_i0592954
MFPFFLVTRHHRQHSISHRIQYTNPAYYREDATKSSSSSDIARPPEPTKELLLWFSLVSDVVAGWSSSVVTAGPFVSLGSLGSSVALLSSPFSNSGVALRRRVGGGGSGRFRGRPRGRFS